MSKPIDLYSRLRDPLGDGGLAAVYFLFLPAEDVTRVLIAALDGIEALPFHNPTVIRGHIKPHNILWLADDSWALAGLSLAKFLPRAVVTTTLATASRQAWSTHGYSAPEQFEDFKVADQRAHMDSLGVLAWELLSRSCPAFDRNCTILPEALKRLVLKPTYRDKGKRQSSIVALRSKLQRAIPS